MFKDIIASLQASLKGVKDKCNAALAKLPPLEQVAASSEIGYGISCIQRACENLVDWANDIEGKMTELQTKAEAMIKDQAALMAATMAETKAGELLTAKLTSGEYLSKADAQAAATTAADTRETAVRATIQKVSTRRHELCTAQGDKPALLSREAVEKLPESLLLADDYAAQATKVKGRMDQLSALNIKPDSAMASECASLALDETGEAAFASKISMIKEISTAAQPGNKIKAPLQGLKPEGKGGRVLEF